MVNPTGQINPPSPVTVIDCSDYQNQFDFEITLNSGVRIVVIKATQGIAHLQKNYRQKYADAKAAGLLATFYHFATNDNAIKQAEWFKKNTADLKMDLPPWIDCEAFTAQMPEQYRGMLGVSEGELFPYMPFRALNLTTHVQYAMYVQELGDIQGYEFPQEDIMWVIANRLEGYQGFAKPDIYTNNVTALKSLRNKSWEENGLAIAHWNTDTPRVPYPWKKYKYWQMGVWDGQKYGLRFGPLDLGRWNEEMYPKPWDNNPPIPPTPAGKASMEFDFGNQHYKMVQE